MSVAVYVIGDSHFGHANILNFTREDGTKLRPFDNIVQMHDYMVTAWNAVVRPQDHVYHLGDVAITQNGLNIALQLQGHKRLVRGNHDTLKTAHYLRVGFKEIYGVRILADLMMTHIPVHPDSLRRNWINVHGHLHNNHATGPRTPHLGLRYYNASAECLNYTPVTLEQIKAEVATWA
jgi:calcineurin-like phosphoesterase family protein